MDQLGLDSQFVVLRGSGYTLPLEVLSPQQQYYFMAFWSLRIFIQKQELKKLYRESAAETWTPAPGHSPGNRQSPLFGLPPDKPSQSIPVKRVSVEAAESAGG